MAEKKEDLVFFPFHQCFRCGRNQAIYIDQEKRTDLGWLVDISDVLNGVRVYCSYDCALTDEVNDEQDSKQEIER